MMVNFVPGHFSAAVQSVEMHHASLSQAIPGDLVGFQASSIERLQDFKFSVHRVHRGFIASDPGNSPAKICRNFYAQILMPHHLTHLTLLYCTYTQPLCPVLSTPYLAQ